MARPTESNEQLLCSFCGKSQREVRKLIAGPTVYICDECVRLCNDIIRGEIEQGAGLPPSTSRSSPDRLANIASALRTAAHEMRDLVAERQAGAAAASIREIADRVGALAAAILLMESEG